MPAQASAASGAPADLNRRPRISAMASTVNSSTQNTWSWMIWLCAYSAGIGPVTPITSSDGWFRYQRTYSFAPAVCCPNEVPGRKYRNVMIVVECSAVPASRPAVLGSGNAPARPGMPPGGPGLSRSGQAGGTQVVGLGQRLRQSRRRGRRLGELALLARLALPVRGQGLADRTDLRGRRQAPRIPLHDGHGGVEREAEQPGRVAFRVRGRRSGRDQLGQPAGGGVQRRQEDDGGGDGGGPPGDDHQPQADHHEGIAPGQQAGGRPGRVRLAGAGGRAVGRGHGTPLPGIGLASAAAARTPESAIIPYPAAPGPLGRTTNRVRYRG